MSRILDNLARFWQRRKEKRISLDWPHRYVIHHVLYKKPNVFMSTSDYRDYSEADFADVVNESIDLLQTVDLDSKDAGLVDNRIRFRREFLTAELEETRILHRWEAVRLRSDVKYQLNVLYRKANRLKARIRELTEEKERLMNEN